MSGFFNDGSADAPKLRVYLNLDTLLDLRADSLWTHADRLDPQARDALLARDGFEGVQRTDDGPAQPQTCLPYCGASRIDQPAQADAIVARHVARGDRCLTLHAGTGLEDDAQASRLVEALLTAADKHRFAVFLETHRATITQDLWRTVQLVRRFPELRLNGDFSHYYCGQEMTYGDWPAKLAFMEPLFARTGFLHGRIASPGCMQVPITAELARRPPQAHGQFDFLAHFRALWSHAIRGFVQHAGAGDVLVFAPELLSGAYYYARCWPDTQGRLVEESDRYAQALIYKDLIRALFAQVQQDTACPAA
ncbi:hypothetical protein [Verminephrobacter eiseniae]|uniref:hypothetical protein n=1 Tax=Verminephrobacter eiseniae TaxID=364317 RepID=UPI002238F6F2|nr:hypothetical protein [Verminephrobacter eiseniae]MCW5238892.1 hypothetical protein [Verminephrobacter eiseniae]